MGTDILLRWNGITEAEIIAQLQAAREFRMDAGQLGYRENALLRLVFPIEYWYNSSAEPMRLDFHLSQATLSKSSKDFLRSAMEGTVPDFKDYALVVSMDKALEKFLEGSGFEKVGGSGDLDYEESEHWLEQLNQFFILGMRKQDEGTNPRVLLSW